MAVVQTGSLLSFSITSFIQLTRMGSIGPGVDFCGRLIGRLPFGKIGQMMVSMGSLEPFVADIWPALPEGVC